MEGQNLEFAHIRAQELPELARLLAGDGKCDRVAEPLIHCYVSESPCNCI